MVKVKIQLPNGKTVSGKIDPGSSFGSLKDFLIKHYKLEGSPDNYGIILMPSNESRPIQNGISDGDTIQLINRAKTRTPFYPDDE